MYTNIASAIAPPVYFTRRLPVSLNTDTMNHLTIWYIHTNGRDKSQTDINIPLKICCWLFGRVPYRDCTLDN